RHLARAVDSEAARDRRRVRARLPSADRYLVFTRHDNVIALLIHLRQRARIDGQAHMLGFMPGEVYTFESRQHANRRLKGLGLREVELDYLVAGELAFVRHI